MAESSGVEFKSFMLKQDRPAKVVIRGLLQHGARAKSKPKLKLEGFKQPAQALDRDISRREKSRLIYYSSEVQNKIPKEHVSPLLPLIPNYDRPSKDASINAALQKICLK
ncbi:hypothetical protein TNCV_432501 [Trichonephila clavipes]|nr:hypothetical protein TNCV_432501 [Trichonephila clavipes]